MSTDEEIARKLQEEFDRENEIALRQVEEDSRFAASLMDKKASSKRKWPSEADLFGDSEEEDSPNKKPSLTRQETNHSISSSNEESEKDDGYAKKECPYGSNCYRKNPKHFLEFTHSKGSFSESLNDKWNRSSPFNFFLTKAKGIDNKYNANQSVHIKEILSESFGELVQSAQFNYKIDVDWLVQCYPESFRSKPLLIVHGFKGREKQDLESEAAKYDHIGFCQARLDIAYGTHHSKMMLLKYTDGIRVVIHTANLVHGDWHQKTQGVWISPLFPILLGQGSGESDTKFRKDLIDYLTAYNHPKLRSWIEMIKTHDFSDCRVHLVASVPGRHTDISKDKWGHLKLRKLLKQVEPSCKQWPIVGQFSSIGSLGAKSEDWLCSEWLSSLSTMGQTLVEKSQLRLVFPSVDNVRLSLEGYPAGGSLPYSIHTAKKQTYLHSFLHVWKSDRNGRTQASPHIKTYMRMSPDGENLAWFACTSANLSKAAWGVLEKKGYQLMIRSYEIGVLFLPKSFSKEVFKIKDDNFLVPFDLPPTPYEKSDHPWIWDIPHVNKPDTHGMKWCPN
ncbi:DgyrCDS11459 [Dimorphilus gyrociliatus]|uniref:DgyrCDS11459 n=1 Tax=Dimorphilus gyrociliatus TaxID=2664684 RepID=A0A7I8W3E8_9ANNE|nr:DgyrCDS11459 [Dimorphilus gyrociliatus]